MKLKLFRKGFIVDGNIPAPVMDSRPATDYCVRHRHSNNSLKKKLKGIGQFFHTRKGFGIINVISEINENVPDRKRLIDEVLNDPIRDEPGLYCNYVRHI